MMSSLGPRSLGRPRDSYDLGTGGAGRKSRRNSAPDRIGRLAERVIRQVGITFGCLCLRVAEETADQQEAVASRHPDRGMCVPQIVDSTVTEFCRVPDAPPKPFQSRIRLWVDTSTSSPLTGKHQTGFGSF